MQCPKCDGEIAGYQTRCLHCGFKFKDAMSADDLAEEIQGEPPLDGEVDIETEYWPGLRRVSKYRTYRKEWDGTEKDLEDEELNE
jgi:hypothetical protein